MIERRANSRAGGFRARRGDDPNPIYYKLQVHLQDKIESGEWKPGDLVPPERKIAADYGVSVGTVRKAVLNLVAEGLLRRSQGRGTMVTGTATIRDNLFYYRFLADFPNKDAVLKIEVLDISVLPPVARINRLLETHPGDDLYLLRRRFSCQGKPIIYSVSYLPRSLLEGLDRLPRRNFENLPFYLAVEDKFGIPTVSNQELLGSAAASREVAEVLSVATGQPLLTIDMLAMTHKKRPYEYRVSYCRTDRFRVLREY